MGKAVKLAALLVLAMCCYADQAAIATYNFSVPQESADTNGMEMSGSMVTPTFQPNGPITGITLDWTLTFSGYLYYLTPGLSQGLAFGDNAVLWTGADTGNPVSVEKNYVGNTGVVCQCKYWFSESISSETLQANTNQTLAFSVTGAVTEQPDSQVLIWQQQIFGGEFQYSGVLTYNYIDPPSWWTPAPEPNFAWVLALLIAPIAARIRWRPR